MSIDTVKEDFLPKYLSSGDDKFYKFLLVYALNKIVLFKLQDFKGTSPEVELLFYHDKFMALHRREGNIEFFKIAKIFRKAAHKIYRAMLKKNMIEKSNKFLNLV